MEGNHTHIHTHAHVYAHSACVSAHADMHTRTHRKQRGTKQENSNDLCVTDCSCFKEFREEKSSAWPQAIGDDFILASQSHF